MSNHIQYRILTWQDCWGKWHACLKKYLRRTFKHSGRTGWSFQGFVRTNGLDCTEFDSRTEALAAYRKFRNQLTKAR